ncbi:MAG: MFS transporter [Chloroflexi bacterium]|nr:MFS transporter [Chloroflexota bacterium]
MGTDRDQATRSSDKARVLGRWRVPFYYGWMIIGVVFLAEFSAGGMGGTTISLYFSAMRDSEGWTLARLLGAVTAQAIAGMVAAPLVGQALDRFGARAVMLFGAISAGIGLILLSTIQEIWQFWILYALVGALGLSELGNLSGPVVVSKWFLRLRGRAMAIGTSGTSIGTVVMSPIIGVLIAQVGWRQSFAVMGMTMMLLMVPVLLVFMRRQPEDLGLLPDGDRLDTPSQDGAKGEGKRKEETAWTLRQALRTRTLWVLIAAMNLASLSAGALIYLQVPFLTSKGMSTQAASLVFTFTWAGFALSRVVWGFLVERVPVHYCLGGAFLARALGPIILIALPFPYSIGPFLLTYGALGGSFQLLQAVAFADYYGRRFQGTIQGSMRPFLSIPSLVGPLFLAWLVDITGSYSPAFLIAGGLGLGAAVVALFATPPQLAESPQAAVSPKAMA